MSITKIKELIAVVDQQKVAIRKAADALKLDFEAIIVDESIPIDERWELWKSAPIEMKNIDPWILHFSILGKEVSWYDDFYKDRHQDVRMADIVEQMEESLAEDDSNPCEGEWTAAQIVDAKEQILKMNLYSFNLDW